MRIAELPRLTMHAAPAVPSSSLDRPLPTPKELPALVGFAVAMVEVTHQMARFQMTTTLEKARDRLGILPPVIARALAVADAPTELRVALEDTRRLAQDAHARIVELLAIPEQPPTLRRPLHQELKVQVDLLLARVKDAESAVQAPDAPHSARR